MARNAPFAGAYITQTYGRPSRGQHAIQVELDRSLYMDEQARVRPNNANFAANESLIVTRGLRQAGQDLGIKLIATTGGGMKRGYLAAPA